MTFTPTEQRFYTLLSDGLPHPTRELFALLDDELAGPVAVKMRVSAMRAKLKLRGEGVFWQCGNYQLVKLLANAYDGVRG